MSKYELHYELYKRKQEMKMNRFHKERELMEQYDNEVYYPELKKLREDCEKIGHIKGRYHNNGLGWEWYYCECCDARLETNQYNKGI